MAGGRRGHLCGPPGEQGRASSPEFKPPPTHTLLVSYPLYDNMQILSLSQGDPKQPGYAPKMKFTSAFSVATFLALEVSDAGLHRRISRVVYFFVQIKSIYVYVCG